MSQDIASWPGGLKLDKKLFGAQAADEILANELRNP